MTELSGEPRLWRGYLRREQQSIHTAHYSFDYTLLYGTWLPST